MPETGVAGHLIPVLPMGKVVGPDAPWQALFKAAIPGLSRITGGQSSVQNTNVFPSS